MTKAEAGAMASKGQSGTLIEGSTAERIAPETREEVLDWIDTNQLARRNLSPDQAALVRGRIYNRAKGGQGGDGSNQHTEQRGQSGPVAKGRTAERIAPALVRGRIYNRAKRQDGGHGDQKSEPHFEAPIGKASARLARPGRARSGADLQPGEGG